VNQGTNAYPVMLFKNPTFGGTIPNYASTSTVTNVMFTNGSGTSLLGVGESSGTGYNPYSCATSAAQLSALSGCNNADPLFVAASTSYWNSIGSFDLRLSASSPALGAGTVGYMSPLRDIAGTLYGSSPSLGAYAGTGSSSNAGSTIGGAAKLSGSVVIH